MFKEAPMHAMIANIPLVVFLIAAVLSILALFVKKGTFNLILFIVTAIGTLGMYGSIVTGQAALEAYHVPAGAATKLLEQHQHLASTVMIIALVATGFTFIQLILAYIKPTKVYKIVSLVSLVLLIVTSVLTLQIVKKGTQLVYKYGVGVEKDEGTSSTPETMIDDHKSS
ncbi:MAG: hypothetical protein P0S95_07840 [Rhabdochlamydiaceae bacterium]|nr:hypothetical protein [Candidatus Amphrikana amoebophyrae]